MCSGRTQQLLPQPHTHTHIPITISPLHTTANRCMCVCVEMEIALWMRHFEQHSTGRSEGSQTAFWDIIQPPTRQMCCAALSLPRLSLGVFLLGKHHLEFAVSRAFSLLCCGCATFSVSSFGFFQRCSSIPWNTCEQFVGVLRSSLMSLVGGRIYNHKTIWDSGWIYRHKVDIWFLTHSMEQVLSAQGYACERRETTLHTVRLFHPAFDLLEIKCLIKM